MDDDMLLDRLRGLAHVEPPVTVDRAGVLQAGRRRRLARRAGAAGAALAIVLGVYPVADALTPDREPVPPAVPSPSETVTPAPRAVVDREAGTITLPMDELRPTAHDSAVMRTADHHFISTCMSEQGFAELWRFQGPVLKQRWESLPYGVWQESDVRENGYEPFLEKRADAEDARSLDGDELQAMVECRAALVDAGLGVDLAELQELGGGDRTAGVDTDEGRAIVEEWHECLAADGVVPPPEDERWLPASVPEAPFDEQVRIGLIDVACKERLDMVQRISDIDAAEQAASLEHHAEYYAAVRSMERTVLEKAREYLEEQGITIPQA